MDWTWQVGTLRPDAENVDWTDAGARENWSEARAAAICALRALATSEGRQEYRFRVGDLEGMAWPGLTADGAADLGRLGESLPPTWP